ncbi:MAG TPA: CAAX prenyl protease-related protein [Chthoniobacterales bacterium]|nr:CAAX prenyl protease-related protein [Chthoniobacterales bacterium]
MDSEREMPHRRKLVAFLLPMAVFIALLTLAAALRKPGAAFWLASPEYWIFPAQTLVCGGILIWFWRDYQTRSPARIPFTVGIGLLVFVLWIAPQQWLGFPSRLTGFNPDTFAGQPVLYWSTILLRFLRLVVVVPLVEEIFWRGFLLRYLVDEKFFRVPFGTFTWLSFAGVTLGFGLAHSMADWVAALITGALYNYVAYRTRNLASCVLAHAVTNLCLGLWIMATRQWGFW